MYVVASLTTIPSRINTCCKETIDSLLHQVDHIYIGVAHHYKRFNCEITIPEYYNEEPYINKLTFVFGEDKGPATKYLGSLNKIPDDSWIFFCDDDQEYKSDLIEKLKNLTLDKSCVYQNRFETFKRYGTSGGLIHGYVGNFVHKSVLSDLHSFPLPECAYHIDDQWMSLYYRSKGVQICSTNIDSYYDIYRKLNPNGYELIGPDALMQLGTRDEKIHELEAYFKVRFIPYTTAIEDM